MELHLEKETALLEAILFLETEPQDVHALSRISELSKDVVEELIIRLKNKYACENSGVELIQISGGWIISPKKDLWSFLKDRYGKKNEAKLSKAAMETLSIIAYSQPITRGEIEAIRGVSADNMIRLLVERNLIKEVGKKDIPGKPVQFGTTKEFLNFLDLTVLQIYRN